jgi:DNA-binding transcriptional ArsR family regulator
MKALKVIKDPEAFKLLGDETRRKIVFLLRVKEMTVSQIAADLNITPQAVYHHIKKLQKGEMIEVAREERLGHLIESYYRATAEVFSCRVGNHGTIESGMMQMKTVLNALQKIGFDLEFDESKVSELVEVQRSLKECCESDKFDDAIAELDDVDFAATQKVQEYAELLSMSEKEFVNRQEVKRKFRDLLVSLIKKQKA